MAMVRKKRQQQPLKILSLTPPPPPSPDFFYNSNHDQFTPVGSPDSPLICDDLSNLEKLAVIDHGSGGTVYKVRCRRTYSVYALKVIHLISGAGADARKHAAREADILVRAADSPYVVRCHGVLRGPKGHLCLVMEYMAGGSLRDLLLTRRRLTEEHIAVVARRVLEGVSHLHELGIVHRDIKPSNLLVSDKGELKLADFGASQVVAASLEDEDDDEACMGTCAYMSPERFDSEGFGGGEDGGGFGGDLWALGVVLLECHLGRFPLVEAGERADWATVMCRVCYGDRGVAEVAEAASEEFKGLVERCLETDWRKRGTAAELLSHPFVAKCRPTASLMEELCGKNNLES